jgi:hypothetical protein
MHLAESILIVLFVVFVGLYLFTSFMVWESKNFVNNKIGLPIGTLASHALLPQWANDAWTPTYYQMIYLDERYFS